MKKSIKFLQIAVPVVLMISMISCNPAAKYEKEEQANIQDYLARNTNVNFVLQASGLYYSETVAGTGATATYNDSAFVKYTGKFLNGTIFDSNVSKSTLYGFIVGDNIYGFDEGVTLMKVGGKATLLIPSNLGYGPSGYYSISGYTPLLYDIELVKVVHSSSK